MLKPSAHSGGFSLHAEVWVAAWDRAGLERLLRYCTQLIFAKDQRKDDLAKEYLARCPFTEGVLFIGKAQEKARVLDHPQAPSRDR